MRALLVFSLVLCGAAKGQTFGKYPFDQWAGENHKPQIRWSTVIAPVVLSLHERQMATMMIVVNGAEAAKHEPHEALVAFARIAKGNEHWDSAVKIPLAGARNGDGARDYGYKFRAFVQPGDCTVSLAICDATTLEYSFKKENLRVQSLKGDALPQAERNVPAVEFLGPEETVDGWWLPEIHTLLNLPVTASHRVPVQVIANSTPPVQDDGGEHAIPWHMADVLPVLKVLGGIRSPEGWNTTHLIDVARQQITYSADSRKIDWPKMRDAIRASGPGLTNVDALARRTGMLTYLHDEMARRLRDAGPLEALIVVSQPMRFGNQLVVEPDPIEGARDARLFYIQYDTPDRRARLSTQALSIQDGRPDAQMQVPGRSPFPAPASQAGSAESRAVPTPDPTNDQSIYYSRVPRPMPIAVISPEVSARQNHTPARASSPGAAGDDFERVLKPMGARIFHVRTPLEFRAAVAAILEELGRL